MKRVLQLIFFLLLFLSLSGQTINDSFFSTSLNKTKFVNVFLPPGYDSNPDLYYPVIYFLHGWGGNQNSAQTIMALADSLINYGIIDPVIIVCANNRTSPYLGSFYVNSSFSGNYEDFMTIDLIDWLESKYRVMPEKNYRTLMGQSMGGYGCFRYAVYHKDKYRAIAAHGSAINYELAKDDIIQEILSENQTGPPYTYDFYNTGAFTKMTFALSGAFTPNINSPQTYVSPQNIEFPVDEQGVLIDSINEKWKPFDPVSYISMLTPADSVAIFFGAGSNDGLHLYTPNVAFKDSLDLAGLDYDFFDHNGGHGMPIAFKDSALRYLDSIMPPPLSFSCAHPSDQLVSNISQFSADLSWVENGSATSWQIRMGLSGFDTTGIQPNVVSTNPYTASGLIPNTGYDWYIRAYCGAGDTSLWVGPVSFTTQTVFRKAPYLIYNGNSTQMQLNWQLNDPITTTVDWGIDVSYDSTTQSTEYGDDHQHKYLFTGLTNATKYFYKVTAGTEEYTGYFMSAPSSVETETSFFVYGDHRTFPERHDSVVKQMIGIINDTPTDQTLVFSTGDLVSDGDIESHWDDQLFATGYPNIDSVLRLLPFQATMGNHERDGVLFAKYFPYPYPEGGGTQGNYWSFDYANVHFSIIDQYVPYDSTSNQFSWLENDLSTTDRTWKFIMLHQPGLAAGYYPNDTNVLKFIQPLAETFGVQMIFAGHVHYYSRGDTNDIVHITTGGGGSNLYDPDINAPGIDVVSKSYHFCKLNIDDGQLRLLAIDRDGDTIDNFLMNADFSSTDLCYAPSDLLASSITQTTAELSWTENGEATQWQVRFDTLGFDTTSVVPILVGDNPYSVSGLSANTSYELYVRAYCSAGDSSLWVGPYGFSTICDQMSGDFVEYFDGVSAEKLPDCWYAISSDSVGFVGTIDSVSFSPSNSVLLFNDSLTSGFFGLVSPELSDLASQQNQIRFMGRAFGDTASLFVGTLTDRYDTTTYSAFDTLLLANEFKEFIVDFDEAYTGADLFIMLRHGLSDSAVSLFVDDFFYEVIPQQQIMLDPIAYWSMDDVSGTTVTDSSGNNLHGVLVNGAQWDANGKISGAVSCDGQNDYVEIPDNDLLDPGTNDFTVSLWVYKRVASSGWDNIWGVNKWNTGAAPGTNEWLLGLGAGGNSNRPAFGIQSGSTTYGTASANDISLNEWHLLTGVREGSEIKLYVDGVLEGTKTVGTVSVNNVGRNIRIANSQMNNYYTDGMFDDLRIYDKALNETEILELFTPVPLSFSNNIVHTYSNITICLGDSIFIDGNWQKSEGIFMEKFRIAAGLDSISTISLKVEDSPTINLGADHIISFTEEFYLNAYYPDAMYRWQDGSTDHSYLVTQEGVYYVVVTNLCGSVADTVEVRSNNYVLKHEIHLLTMSPNPFTNSLRLNFYLGKQEKVIMAVYSIHGDLVKTLINNMMEEGKHELVWNGTGDTGQPLQSGIYFLKLITKSSITYKTIVKKN